MSDVVKLTRAILSVYDKTGLEELGRGLADAGVELVSTGSTAAALRAVGIPVTDVAEVTGFPEVMDGRVKTLHPAIHAGILADRGKQGHLATLAEQGIAAIDLVVGNLYPFRQTVAGGAGDDEVVEMIDIGGPTMVRAAAKNHAWVTVLTTPELYPLVLAELAEHGGTTLATRRLLARQAFAHTASYDADVAAWFARDDALPDRYAPVYRKALDLRYGENPHQQAAWYVERGRWGLGSAAQLGGKELSSNNLLDADAAWGLANDLAEPCVAIIKHTNPAGCAVGDTLAEAYPRALAGDPVSAYGGIVACNRAVDAATAQQVTAVFTEVVIAPSYDDEALEILRSKPNLRILAIANPEPPEGWLTARTLAGGVLVQTPDVLREEPSSWTVPTTARPDAATLAELAFAWTVCKHAKSNAIVLTRHRAVVGVGTGQMSRVDSVRIAITKSEGRSDGAVLASDAFFPFRDGPDVALDAGVRAIVMPGGSIRDEEVIAACDERGVPAVVTGVRHFRH